ncbi:MAG: hypothetical protein SCALA702_01690 [Melioribacteraceae bacterium]|nr:MAG: hypothetical protein SCALA702_01690 [Melioribacteraceae bacterium]
MLKIEIKDNNRVEAAFFEHFNPVKKDGNLMKRSLILMLKDEHEKAGTTLEKDLYRFLRIRLKNIITGKPEVLNEIIKYFNKMFPIDIFYKFDDEGKKVDSLIAERIKEIFNYKTFRSSEFCVNYLRELGFEPRVPCPYCNFDELSIVTRNGEDNNLALLDLDHFVPQSKYPFLALSMYNLVPSCHNCNYIFKRETLFLIDTHINPFDKSFDEYFQFSLQTPFIYGMDINDFLISCKTVNGFRDDSLRDLCIIERYNTAKEELLKKLNLIYKMTKSKKEELESIFENDINGDLMQLAEFPTSKSDIVKFKLGKIKRDIYLESWTNN